MRRRFWTLVSAFVILGFAFLAPPVSADTSVICRSHNLGITFHIYNNENTITFNGVLYSSGQYTVVAWGCGQSYPISATGISTCGPGAYGFFCFQQWSSDAGTFGNQTSLSTRFYPLSASFGGITLVIGSNSGTFNWGGYVTMPAVSETTYTVSGRFVLPTAAQIAYVAPPNGGNDYVAAWVGLGGCAPSVPACAPSNLWQAGVDIKVQTGNAISIWGWYEEVKSDRSCCAQASVGSTVNPGDTIFISVSTTPSTSSVSFTLQDLGGPTNPNNQWSVTQGCTARFKCISGFVPDTSSAEWIVEAPQDDGNQNCGTGGALHQCVMPNYGSFSIPAQTMSMTGFTAWDMSFLRLVGTDFDGRFTNPGYISSGWIGGSYSDAWSTTIQW